MASRNEKFRLRLMRTQLAYEKKYKKNVNTVLADQIDEVMFNLEAHSKALDRDMNVTIKTGQKLFDDAAADAAMEKIIMPTLINLGEDQGALALLFAGDEDTQFRMTAPYEKLLRDSTKKMSSRFNDDTLARLNKTLAEGIQAGEALSKLRARVEDVYDYKSRVASLRVARTETLKASNNATEEAYRQTTFVKAKQWVVNPGACPECEVFDGKVIDLGESFLKQGESYSYTDEEGGEQTSTNSYDDVDNPPLHPNCRCTIVPVR